jgi:hypothetical protein
MVKTFEITSTGSHDELMQDLLEIIAVEFLPVDGGWHADTYGGSRLDLKTMGPGRFLLRVEDDPSHRLYRNEQKTFGRLENMDRWFPGALRRAGYGCTKVE